MKRGVLLRGEIAGTAFGYAGELTVTEDAGIRIVGSEGLQEIVECELLGLGTSVGWMAVLVKASLVDDAKGAPVVAFHMDALDALRQERDDTAIVADIVVVGHLTVFLLSAVDQGFHAEGAVAAAGHAVHDEILHNF